MLEHFVCSCNIYKILTNHKKRSDKQVENLFVVFSIVFTSINDIALSSSYKNVVNIL